MENTNNKRLRALQSSGAEKIFEAYNWVQEHQHEFNKPVYGPVLLEVYKYAYATTYRPKRLLTTLVKWKLRSMFPIGFMQII